MELDEKKLNDNIFKSQVYDEKSVDFFIKDAYEAINKDDKKISEVVDQLMLQIREAIASMDEDERVTQISFLAPILAELFKSSAEFKKQKTDLLNSIQRFLSLDKKNQPADGNIMDEIWKDILKRKEDEQDKKHTK